MTGTQLWLFDCPPVTWPEIRLWVGTHAPHIGTGERFTAYVRGWDIAGKIAEEKIKQAKVREKHYDTSRSIKIKPSTDQLGRNATRGRSWTADRNPAQIPRNAAVGKNHNVHRI